VTQEPKPSVPATSNAGGLSRLQQLCGDPPVLSSESMEDYNCLVAELVKYFAPQDFIAEMHVKDAADAIFEAARFNRYKNLLIERQHSAFEASRKRASAQMKEKLAKGAPSTRPPSEPDQVVEGLVEEIDAIVEQNATALDHARALEAGLDIYAQLDRHFGNAIARRDDALEQLAPSREARGYRLRSGDNEIIEGHCNVVATPRAALAAPDVPSSEQR
jgi:hypothetical protein